MNSYGYRPRGDICDVLTWSALVGMGISGAVHSHAIPPEIRCTGGQHGAGAVRVAYSPNAPVLASAGGTDRLLRAMTTSGCVTDSEFDDVGPADLVAFSPNGEILATASFDLRLTLSDGQTGEFLRETALHANNLMAIAFSPDGQIVATVDGGGYVVKLWRASDAAQLAIIVPTTGQGPIPDLCFSPDGQLLAISLTRSGPSFDESIELWQRIDDSNWTSVGSLTGHANLANSIAFAADGGSLFAGDAVGVIRQWRLADGQVIGQYLGHSGSLEAIALSSDGRQLASAGTDGTIRLWRVPAGYPLHTYDSEAAPFVSDIEFSPDDATFAYGRGDGVVVIAENPHCLAGDLTGDRSVGLSDLSVLLGRFGLCTADAGFLPLADIDGRGCIDLPDLSVLLSQFGLSCP